jgi:hypothetical protein
VLPIDKLKIEQLNKTRKEQREMNQHNAHTDGIPGLGTSTAHGSKHSVERWAFVVLLLNPIHER